MDINPKQFASSVSKEKSPLVSNRDEFGKDDDDPLSIRDASSTVFGLIFAFMSLFLPAISVFLERPFLHKNGVNYKEIIIKDGY